MKRTYLIRFTQNAIIAPTRTVDISLFEFLNQPEAQTQLFDLLPAGGILFCSLDDGLDEESLSRLSVQIPVIAARFGFFCVTTSIQSHRMFRLIKFLNHPLLPVTIVGLWLVLAIVIMQVSASHIRTAREWQVVLAKCQAKRAACQVVPPESQLSTANAMLLTRFSQMVATPLVLDRVSIGASQIQLLGYLSAKEVDSFFSKLQCWPDVQLVKWDVAPAEGGYSYVQLALAAR